MEKPSGMVAFLMGVDGWVEGSDPPKAMEFYKTVADALDKSLGVTQPADIEDDFMREEIRNAADDWKKERKMTSGHVSLALRAQKAAGSILNHMGRAVPCGTRVQPIATH